MDSWRSLVAVLALLVTACGGAGEDAAEGSSDVVVQDVAGKDVAEEVKKLEIPVCPPQCSGRECGADQCGGSCGNCFSLEGAVDNSLCMESGL